MSGTFFDRPDFLSCGGGPATTGRARRRSVPPAPPARSTRRPSPHPNADPPLIPRHPSLVPRDPVLIRGRRSLRGARLVLAPHRTRLAGALSGQARWPPAPRSEERRVGKGRGRASGG